MGFDLLGTKNVNVIAGDIPAGEYEFEYGSLVNKMFPTDATRNFELSHNTKSVTLQSEQEAKNWLVAGGFALVGAMFGPFAAIAGLCFGGHHKTVCVAVETKDGKKFMAATNMGIAQTLQAYAMVGESGPLKKTKE